MKKKGSSVGSFIVGAFVGYFMIYPAVHGTWDTRFDEVKELFGFKKKVTSKYHHYNELDKLTLTTFRNTYGKSEGTERYNFYKSVNNRSNQLNPNNDAYWQSRGYKSKPENWNGDYDGYKSNTDNRSNQLNPNNDAYWQSRGHDSRPSNWSSSSNYGGGSDASQAAANNHANQMNPNNSAYNSSRGK